MQFIDAPVKTYSTGMRARLGFSIATAITPDILLLDEVLGTGDQTFRARSQARVRELVNRAKAIVLVTHDLTFVSEFCNRAILLEKGQIIQEGEPGGDRRPLPRAGRPAQAPGRGGRPAVRGRADRRPLAGSALGPLGARRSPVSG